MTSPFQVGVVVALVKHNWDRRIFRRVVGKVRKDGKFFLKVGEDVLSTQMWTPGRGDETMARLSGNHQFSHEHVELWRNEHDAELSRQRGLAECRKMISDVRYFIDVTCRHPDETTQEVVAKIHALLPKREEKAQ